VAHFYSGKWISSLAPYPAHELHRSTNAVGDEDLSEDALYWGSKQLDTTVRGGTTFKAARDALRKWGQPIESVWPYDSSLDESDPHRPPSGIKPGEKGWYRIGIRKVRCTVDSVRRELRPDVSWPSVCC